MSMYRQLWLAIIASMLLALGGGLLASLLSARGYLESQLAIKNTDNATALALALLTRSLWPMWRMPSRKPALVASVAMVALMAAMDCIVRMNLLTRL